MNYSEKLKDPRWQKKRLTILERDNWKCRECGASTISLNVHHKKYRNCDPWNYNDDELITLCECCHTINHLFEKLGLSEKEILKIRTTYLTMDSESNLQILGTAIKELRNG